ncbi:Katanin p60 ATPase-containing subunit, putative [Perkinsus marinus ATCC 50983]|uniref:Katanin p60 ATPase-containing subunit, putative n=1 Tax=Perkinsus marinus (strain ATCC 50983 / TXsc) TaxID=423536 RepID=C5LBR5_PERM5|nr:Katanin p60 ATPase-containing subunit, putative [Perkinsus marinus ATCC 50983]EER05886.1 Katanin p60 ATPase-containing subunit, putative [Perkinsus marinus ATCC 50983]|eukprot:XP_002774070.1 Katanin p60 ATPase-containing subunit, putative [Perkinsus marinus ATCC 50983]
MRSKIASIAREVDEKRAKERRRSCLVLAIKFLRDSGLTEAAACASRESGLNERFQVADNIALELIVKDFEDYHAFKYGQRPVIVKKAVSEGPSPTALPDSYPRPNALVTTSPQRRSIPTKASPPEGTGSLGYQNDAEMRELAQSICRDILTRKPLVNWSDVIGCEDAKRAVKEAVVFPLKFPDLFHGPLLSESWRGVLLFGPPGVGKTMLAKAVATECGTTFFNVSASTVVSKWRGDSEKLIRCLFELALAQQPSTIFIDEIDSLMSQRGSGDSEHEGSRRLKTELLIQMDGLTRRSREKCHVFVLAASNLPWDLDKAMLRRLEKRILVDFPDKSSRHTMARTFLMEYVCESNLDSIAQEVASRTEGWSGDDIRLLCKESAMIPLRRHFDSLTTDSVPVRSVTYDDVLEAFQRVGPAGGDGHGMSQRYRRWADQFGSV